MPSLCLLILSSSLLINFYQVEVYGFDSIGQRTGARKNYKGFEVRVVQKKNKRSDKNLAISGEYLASSGVLKYLGCFLMVLIMIHLSHLHLD